VYTPPQGTPLTTARRRDKDKEEGAYGGNRGKGGRGEGGRGKTSYVSTRVYIVDSCTTAHATAHATTHATTHPRSN
jgi:hypothetical protein